MAIITGNKPHVYERALEDRHRETLNWLSAIKLWQKEIAFFQTMLDGTAHYFTSPEDKKKLSRFQNLFIYYHAELLLDLRTRLRNHENHLVDLMTKKNADESIYINEHDPLMLELSQFASHFTELKNEFFLFIEKIDEIDV